MLDVSLRCELRPGDVGEIVRWHGVTYAQEHGFDVEFEGNVATKLGVFAASRSPRERIWLAESGARLVGCIAIVDQAGAAGMPQPEGGVSQPEGGVSQPEGGISQPEGGIAQLRWVLVDPPARGRGLGTRLVGEAVAFARQQGYRRVSLWTVSSLGAAARLYLAAGFRLVEERPAHHWGVDVVEQRYERGM